jgi:hypothetical protein
MVNTKTGQLIAIDNGLSLNEIGLDDENIRYNNNYDNIIYRYSEFEPELKEIIKNITEEKIDKLKEELLDSNLIGDSAYKFLLGRILHVLDVYHNGAKSKIRDKFNDYVLPDIRRSLEKKDNEILLSEIKNLIKKIRNENKK